MMESVTPWRILANPQYPSSAQKTLELAFVRVNPRSKKRFAPFEFRSSDFLRITDFGHRIFQGTRSSQIDLSLPFHHIALHGF